MRKWRAIIGQFVVGAVIGTFGGTIVVGTIGLLARAYLPGAYDSYSRIPEPWPFSPIVIIAGLNGLISATEQYKRQRRRQWLRTGCCKYCGYDLQGLPTQRCPECGRRFKKKKGRRERKL